MIDDEDNKGVDALLNSKDKGVCEAKGILSRIFRQVLVELAVTPTLWNQLMNKYLDDARNRVPRTSKGRSSTRGNLSKELRKVDMTWGNFEKAVRFLNPISAEFSITMKWRGGKSTKHSFSVFGEKDSDEAVGKK